MVRHEQLAQHGLGQMNHIAREAEIAPYLPAELGGRSLEEMVQQEQSQIKTRTIQEIIISKQDGEVQGDIRVQISSDEVRMDTISDHPGDRRKWLPIILAPGQKKLIRKYAGLVLNQ